MRRGFIAIATIISFGFPSLAQGPDEYWIGLEEHAVHTEGELAGMTTWRMYVNTLNSTDFISSCYGAEDSPMIIESTSTPGWYNHAEISEVFATAINPVFFSTFPELEYDSWLTIGVASALDGYDVTSIADPFYDAFAAFEAGENIISNTQIGNAWFSLFPGLEALDNPAFAGDDLKVLLGQITTSGEISGEIYVQIFPEGIQENDLRISLPIHYAPLQCNDASACNYNADSWLDEECIYSIDANNLTSIVGESSVVVNEGTTEWTYSAPGVMNEVYYEWNTGNGATIVSGQGTSTIVVDWGSELMDPTQLSVTLYIEDDCPGEPAVLDIDFIMGQGEIDYTSSLNAFPNPASNEVQINFDSEFNTGMIDCQLVSMSGQIVRTFVINNGVATIDVSGLASGTYVLSLNTELGAVRESLVVKR